MEPSDYDKIPLCKILYSVRGTGLLAEQSRWRCTTDHNIVAVQRSPCAPTPAIPILIQNRYIDWKRFRNAGLRGDWNEFKLFKLELWHFVHCLHWIWKHVHNISCRLSHKFWSNYKCFEKENLHILPQISMFLIKFWFVLVTSSWMDWHYFLISSLAYLFNKIVQAVEHKKHKSKTDSCPSKIMF
jgi:hypothetical protein